MAINPDRKTEVPLAINNFFLFRSFSVISFHGFWVLLKRRNNTNPRATAEIRITIILTILLKLKLLLKLYVCQCFFADLIYFTFLNLNADQSLSIETIRIPWKPQSFRAFQPWSRSMPDLNFFEVFFG